MTIRAGHLRMRRPGANGADAGFENRGGAGRSEVDEGGRLTDSASGDQISTQTIGGWRLGGDMALGNLTCSVGD